MNGYLLDTNHCSRLIEGDPRIVERLEKLGGALVVTCVIVRGELIFMAHRSEHRVVNEARVREFLGGIGVYALDAAADVYGKLKAAIIAHFGPRKKAQRRKTKIEEIGFQENDLCGLLRFAKCHGFVVVSADSDFERIAEAEDLSIEKWWSPGA